MGYHITLARKQPLPGITGEEWRQFVLSRPELTLVPAEQRSGFITAILRGREDLALHYCNGEVFTKNPEGPEIIAYMASIAPHLEAVVTGDEGELYTKESDWGTPGDWRAPAPKKSFWRRELTPANVVKMAILVLFAAVFISRYFGNR